MSISQVKSFRPAGEVRSGKMLEVQGLTVAFPTSRGVIRAVCDLSFYLKPAETVAIVGESGSGKSVTGKALLGLVEPPGILAGGRVLLDGENVFDKTGEEKRRLRGAFAGMVFQDPGASFDPVFTVGWQMVESILAHGPAARAGAKRLALECLASVGFANPQRIYGSYPHELSGGMKQRAYIAMVMSLSPGLIVADEPTTALDMVNQARILSLLKNVQAKTGCGVIVISHDLEVVAGLSDRVLVMYGGHVVEAGPTGDIMNRPGHPYTRGLVNSSYRGVSRKERLSVIDGQTYETGHSLSGCSFAPRCGHASPECRKETPPLMKLPGSRFCRCLKTRLGGTGGVMRRC